MVHRDFSLEVWNEFEKVLYCYYARELRTCTTESY